MKRIIILGQGRSGSTLVKRVLNTIPNSYIAGDNKNFWYHIYQARISYGYIPIWEVKIAEKAGQKPYSYNTKTDSYKPCWFNKNWHKNHAKINKTAKSLFNSFYNINNQKFFGFKEIRFPETQDEFNDYLDWWRLIFPDIYFIFTVRNINTLQKSGWWKPKDREKLLNQEKLLRSRTDGFLMEYENFDWKGLFDFIDEPYNESEVQRILNKKL